jgi:hypothetical protein
MKYAIESATSSMIYIPSFTAASSGIHVMLTLLPQPFLKLHCWYYRREGFIKYEVCH